MKRLFFSLYFVVVIALAFIGWSTEFVWQYLQTTSDSEVAQLARLSKSMRLIDNLDQPEQLQKLRQALGSEVSTLDFQDVAWLDENKHQLINGETVLIYNEQDKLSIYLLALPDRFSESSNLNKQLVIKVGPISLFQQKGEQQYQFKQRLLILFSYLLLALVIGLWSWPLWRDLRLLQQATDKFGRGEWQVTISVSDKSVIAPVVKTFKSMSTRISNLLEEQKNLTNAISHELRTPLARLKFSLALLNKNGNQNISQTTTDSFLDMQKDISELESLVDEILNYSRLESQPDELLLASVNINQLLENLVEKLQINSNKQINLKITETINWLCDGHYLERAIQNLLTNAIYYANNQVSLEAIVKNNRLLISVEDDGKGIKSTQQKTIFKPFVRLDKSRPKKSGGFGLGLAIVKRIIEKHRGYCDVTNASLGGAKFTISLPRQGLNE